jgi:hypothetical protein
LARDRFFSRRRGLPSDRRNSDSDRPSPGGGEALALRSDQLPSRGREEELVDTVEGGRSAGSDQLAEPVDDGGRPGVESVLEPAAVAPDRPIEKGSGRPGRSRGDLNGSPRSVAPGLAAVISTSWSAASAEPTVEPQAARRVPFIRFRRPLEPSLAFALSLLSERSSSELSASLCSLSAQLSDDRGLEVRARGGEAADRPGERELSSSWYSNSSSQRSAAEDAGKVCQRRSLMQGTELLGLTLATSRALHARRKPRARIGGPACRGEMACAASCRLR